MPAPIRSALSLSGRDLSGATAVDPRANERRRLPPRILRTSTAVPPRRLGPSLQQRSHASNPLSQLFAGAMASRPATEPKTIRMRPALRLVASVRRGHETAPLSTGDQAAYAYGW